MISASVQQQISDTSAQTLFHRNDNEAGERTEAGGGEEEAGGYEKMEPKDIKNESTEDWRGEETKRVTKTKARRKHEDPRGGEATEATGGEEA
ncbi:hypothetical protein Mapa_013143 [Marchantia paleacea]|nr:hypothetical protein Mapa_013143 [Marchantia paleacea]